MGGKLFNFMLFSLVVLVHPYPTKLRLHAFVAMHSIMLAMGSVGQGKLVCAILIEAFGGKLSNFKKSGANKNPGLRIRG